MLEYNVQIVKNIILLKYTVSSCQILLNSSVRGTNRYSLSTDKEVFLHFNVQYGYINIFWLNVSHAPTSASATFPNPNLPANMVSLSHPALRLHPISLFYLPLGF